MPLFLCDDFFSEQDDQFGLDFFTALQLKTRHEESDRFVQCLLEMPDLKEPDWGFK
jgi:hypothetical protein